MKKGVVLFITLLFITAISILILKNLTDTDLYINEQNSKFAKTQIMMYLNNVKDEISNIISKNQRNKIKSYLNIDYPINLQGAEITIRLQKYDKYNINLLKNSDKKSYLYLQSFFESNDIYDIETFKYIIKDNDDIKTNKQLDELIDVFAKQTYKNEIYGLKDYLGFINFDKKGINIIDENEDNIFYELYVKVNYLKQFAKAYYILNKSGGVEYFELSFK